MALRSWRPEWALLTLTGVDSSWLVTQPGLLLAGIGTGLYNPSASALALGSVPQRHSGLASGINDTFRQAGSRWVSRSTVRCALIPGAAAIGHGPAAAFLLGLHHALWLAAEIAGGGTLAGAQLLRRPAAITDAGLISEAA